MLGSVDPSEWLLTQAERGNPSTVLDERHEGETAWSTGNLVRPLIHGATYFPTLYEAIEATQTLRGHGLPGSNGGPTGDMVIVVHVLVPSDLSDEQQELARKLGESLEPRNLRSSGGGDDGFFSRVRRAFG